MRVAVLGAGLQGVCAALELAAHGFHVDLFDQAETPLNGSSKHNEGKIAERLGETRLGVLDWALCEVCGLSQPRALSQLKKSVRFRLDQWIVGAGWHGREEDARWGYFRWSGPDNESDLHLPLIIDADFRIRLHVPFGMPFGLAETGVSLFVNRIPLKVHLTSNSGGDWYIQAVVRAEEVLKTKPLTVTLCVARTVQPAEFSGSSDTRVLGVPVSWIEVEPDVAIPASVGFSAK